MPTAPPSRYRPSCATATANLGSRGETATSGSTMVSGWEPGSAGRSWRAISDTLSAAGRGAAVASPTAGPAPQVGPGVERRGVLHLVESRPGLRRSGRHAPDGVQDAALHGRADVVTGEDPPCLSGEGVVAPRSDAHGR